MAKKKQEDTILRKRKYNKDMPKILIDHMALGLSLRSFCAVVNIHHSTLYEWVEKHQEFKDAMEIGIDKSRLFWERQGISLVTGASRGSAKVWEINMYNRFRDEWARDRSEEKESDNSININLKYDPRNKDE